MTFCSSENCFEQKDYFDSNGNYWKTICTIRTELTKDLAKKACEAQQMTLASVDDLPEGEAIVVYRMSKEYPNGGNMRIGGENGGLCSIITSLAPGNYIRTFSSCTEARFSYCEFNGILKLTH